MIRVFINNFQFSEEFDVTNLKKLKALLGSRLYNTYIPANKHIKRAKEMGLPIHLIDKYAKTPSRGALAFRILAKNILKEILPELFVETNRRLRKVAVSKLSDVYTPPTSKKSGDPLKPTPASTEPLSELDLAVEPGTLDEQDPNALPRKHISAPKIIRSGSLPASASIPIVPNPRNR
jgi:hypothetical protein